MDHLALESRDLDEAEAILREQYTSKIVVRAGATPGLRIHQDMLGPVVLGRINYFMDVDLAIDEPIAGTFVSRLHRGQLTYQIGRQNNQWTAGEVFLAVGAGGTLECAVRDCDVEFAVIDPATFASVAQSADGAAVGLTGYTPVSADAARFWVTSLDFARQVAGQPEVTPLVRGATARLLAASTLATFPNNALTAATIEDRHDAHPPTVRRAVAFMESHPDLDLTVVDVARAAFVTPRALQLAFRRHLNTTPMAYLRRVRLDRAHADLRAADPARDTVTAIAARWGWARPSRFAADYRAAYDQHPHDTLRS